MSNNNDDEEIKKIIAIFCPSLSLYSKQPSDQSICELVNCPECNLSMWLSEKKKIILSPAKKEKENVEIVFACYDCFQKKVNANFDFWKNHIRVDI
jgi:hypothetical protein